MHTSHMSVPTTKAATHIDRGVVYTHQYSTRSIPAYQILTVITLSFYCEHHAALICDYVRSGATEPYIKLVCQAIMKSI